MKNLKKRIISALLSVAMLIPMQAISVMANTENPVTKVYADLYGLDIVYTGALDEGALPSVTLTGDNGVVSYTKTAEDNTLHLHFETPINKDDIYILTDNAGMKKSVQVKELFTENFNSEAVSTASNVVIDKTNWQSGTGNGTFIANGSAFGGNNSNMLAVTNSAFYVKKTEVLQERDLTVSADVVLMKRETGSNSANNPGGGISLRAKNNNYTDSYRLLVYKQRNELGIHNYSSNSSYSMISEPTNLKIAKAHTGNEDVGGVMDNGLAELNYNITTQGKEKSYVLRNYDNVIGAYYSGGYIGTVIDTEDRYSQTSQGVAFQSDTHSVMLIDNVSITKCVVEDIVENPITKVYADIYGLDIVYTDALTEAPTVTLKDRATDDEVACTVALEEKILHLHFTTPIEKNKEYILQAGDYKKSVVVKEIFAENFDNEPVSTASNVDIDKTDWHSVAGNGTFIANGSAFGGNNSNMLAVTNSAFYVKKAEVLQERDLTVSADVVLMQRTNNNPAGGICLRAKNNDWANAYRLRVYGARNDVAVYATDSTTVATNAKSHTDIRGVMTNGLANLDYTISQVGTEKSYVLRNYDNVAGGYYDGTYLGTLIDTNNHFSTTAQGVAFQSDTNSVMLIDNVSVTKCEVSAVIDVSFDAEAEKVIVNNQDKNTQNIVVVVAAYDESNKMLDAYLSDITEFNPGTTDVEYTLSTPEAVIYKAFCWSNLTDLIPYCKAAEHEVEQ